MHLIGGPTRLLRALGDPWRVRLPGSMTVDRGSTGVRYEPREQADGIVTRRARWFVPSDQAPPRYSGRPVWRWLADIRSWREHDGIPTEIFATISRHQRAWEKDRKPVWIAFDSPIALRWLDHQLAAEPTTVTFTEALPGRGSLWPPSDGYAQPQAFATEYMSLIDLTDNCEVQ